MKKQVNLFELFIYFGIWILSSLYSLFQLYMTQTEILTEEEMSNLEDLKPGWHILQRLQDVSDIEWSSWKYFIKIAWCYLVINFVVSEIIRSTKMSLLKYWYIVSSLVFISLKLNYVQILYISVQPIIFSFVIFCGAGKLCVWIASIVILLSFNFVKYKHFIWDYLDYENVNDEDMYLMLFAVPWTELRCISFCIDYINKRDKLQEFHGQQLQYKESLFSSCINMFSYVLYLPLLYTGPVVLYDEFENSFTRRCEPLKTRLQRFTWDIFLYTIYTIFLDISLHYIYFYAMKSNMKLLRMLPSYPLCGGGLWMGLEFHMKYVISYGTTCAFSRLDNIEAPPTPRCIARIHVYSQMWKYFDVALYRFLVKYVYKPTFTSIPKSLKLPNICKKLFASFVTFVYTYTWHGHRRSILIWAILNYFGIFLEQLGDTISKTKTYMLFKNNVLRTDEMEIRFIALICSPLLALSAIANFYLFAGSKVGNLFFERFALFSYWNLFIFIPLYCCCHVSMSLKDVPSRTDVKTVKPVSDRCLGTLNSHMHSQ